MPRERQAEYKPLLFSTTMRYIPYLLFEKIKENYK